MKTRGGLGIGELTKAGFQDGIERFVILLSRRRTTTEAELERYQADYVQVAKVFQAMAELAPHRASDRVKKNPRELQEWVKVTGEFKHLSAEFRHAIEEKAPKKVRLAAMNLSQTCCECHTLAER